MSKTVRVGIIGLGSMGSTHLAAYRALARAEVVAVADRDRNARGAAGGNIAGQGAGSLEGLDAAWFDDGRALIDHADVDLIDICAPTPAHVGLAMAAVEAGRHVLVEKPIDLSSARVRALADAAKAAGVVAMPAMCMRFWPGWDWLKAAVDDGRYGRVLGATFTRLAPHPGGAFYRDADASGAALFDLHIHDTDFVHHCFGVPATVASAGYAHVTPGVDHVVTRYGYGEAGPPLVVAEGGWAMAGGFTFTMRYTVNFERATARFDLDAPDKLVISEGGTTRPIALADEMGYAGEIRYLVDCLSEGRPAARSTMASAATTTAILEAERRSIEAGGDPVRVVGT